MKYLTEWESGKKYEVFYVKFMVIKIFLEKELPLFALLATKLMIEIYKKNL